MQGAMVTGGNFQRYRQESYGKRNFGEHNFVDNNFGTGYFRPRPLTVLNSGQNYNWRSYAQVCKERSDDLENNTSNNYFLNKNNKRVLSTLDGDLDGWTIVERKKKAFQRNSNFSGFVTNKVVQPSDPVFKHQSYNRPITVYYPRPWLSKGLSGSSSVNVESVNKSTPALKHLTNFLPQPLFKIAKTMCSVLKSTHHLVQVEGRNVPQQISKQASWLKSFPKPFAPNDSIKKSINEIADQWSNNLCKNLRFHYESVRLSNLVILENSFESSDEEWNSCLELALKWTRSSFKNFSEIEFKEGRELIFSARRKQKVLIDSVVSSFSAAPFLEPAEVIENEEREPTDSTSAVECVEAADSLVPSEGNNSISFANIGKKLWKLPENLEFKKLLITDENFVGPVSLDFFHVTFPSCSVWDLYNVIRNSVLPKDLSLVLIHAGYKTNSQNNLKYIKTIAEKVKNASPNAKLFFTSLVSKSVNADIARFNKICKEEYSDFFLDCDLREISFTTVQDKSEKLFVEWIKTLISLN
jgi:hypothetical protein